MSRALFWKTLRDARLLLVILVLATVAFELLFVIFVREMLQDLSQQAYFLAVATGKSRVGLNRALNAVKLLSLFDATRCADETFSKPHLTRVRPAL